ncbi:MAG: S9 family peptidase [Chitinophagaceae bacterium]|jgi:dipeptidyl aminopeptidase/acylaminoacyl peptidase|nr:S9 family peptidase [Chitinophagaceae bacterium]
MRKAGATFIFLLSLTTLVSAQTKRVLKPTDIFKMPSVSDPQVSPDGQWVAYTLTTVDSIKDNRSTDIWMVSWDGKTSLQLTFSPESESAPRWSPDGKYLSFLSSRQEGKGSQLWLLDRRGGEAKRVTTFKSGISAYAWAPDGKKVLLTITDPEPEDSGKVKTAKPMVMDKYKIKQDVQGYRYKNLYSHLYLFDIEKKKTDTLTKGSFNHSAAVWSPDGTRIAFVSNQTEDPDKNENTDIFIIDAKPGSVAKKLTTWTGSDNNPQWSPDGQRIVYTRSTSPENYAMYDQPVLTVVSASGGEPQLLSQSLDRGVGSPRWLNDNTGIIALVTDDREQYPALFVPATNAYTKIEVGNNIFQSTNYAGGKWAVLASNPTTPTEVYAFENSSLRRLTFHTDSLMKNIKLAKVSGVTAKAKDGNTVNGVLYRPADSAETKPMPLLLIIHGGPVAQDDYGFNMQSQVLAGAGYAVVNVNYRGSNGRGLAYTKAISGDWGNLEVVDLHAVVDELVKQGIADSARLGVGGWSYGGILTDYLIATDTRFKAAVSGAGVGFTMSLYGVDQYIMQYDNEIGPPWKNLDTYLKIGYPLLKADRIKTPTLFMVGEKDFNVPAVGSEQMYQALRSQGIPTQYVVYPGQFHGITVPSYQADRLTRYIEWFNKYIKK